MTFLVAPTDPVLRTVCQPYPFDAEGHDPVAFESMLVGQLMAHDGIGLAAPQIGISYRAFAFRDDPPGVMFNPVIVDVSSYENEMEEACLSVPGIVLAVKRPKAVRVRYKMSNGTTATIKLGGLSAVTICHEIDHLNGTLFIDRVSKIKYSMAKDKARKQGFLGPFPKQQEIIYDHG